MSGKLTTQNDDVGLKRHIMPTAEVIAQSVASIAPSAVIAFIVAGSFITAGFATIYTYVLATILMLLAGYCVSCFARLHPTAGSIYIYVGKGIGKPAAYLAGMCIMIASWSISTGAMAGFSFYFGSFLAGFGIPTQGLIAHIILTIAGGASACALTVLGIRASTRVSFILEIASLCVIIVLCAFAIGWAGTHGINPFDIHQIFPKHAHISGVFEGLVLAILGFVGFASVDSLGREAKNPRKTIPRAIFWSVLVIGVIYVFTSYAQVLVLGKDLGQVPVPLSALSTKIGFPVWYQLLILLGVSASLYAVIIAPLNLVGRVLYVMGSENVVKKEFGVAHRRYQTPSRALIFSTVLSLVVVIIFELFGANYMNILYWVDTWGTYGYMLGYVLIAVAAIRYVPLHDPKRGWSIRVAGIILILAMLGTFEQNVYPVPAFPYNLLPYLFLATVVIAMLWFWYLHAKRPDVYAIMGTKHTEGLPTN